MTWEVSTWGAIGAIMGAITGAVSAWMGIRPRLNNIEVRLENKVEKDTFLPVLNQINARLERIEKKLDKL